MSVPNLTRYWVGCGLETEELTVDGVTVLLYPNSDQVSRLARLRAKGFAWETWLNPDWRLARARRNGELARLLESGLSEAAAMHAICGPRSGAAGAGPRSPLARAELLWAALTTPRPLLDTRPPATKNVRRC